MNLQRVWMLLFVVGLTGCADEPVPKVDEPEAISQNPELPAETPTPEPYIERLTDTDEIFELVGFDTHAYRYSGGFVECWIEVEMDGEKVVLAREEAWLDKVAALGNSPYAQKDVHGYILFIERRNPVTLFSFAKDNPRECHLVSKVLSGKLETEDGSTSRGNTFRRPIVFPISQPSREPEPTGFPSTFIYELNGRLPLQLNKEVCLYMHKLSDDYVIRLKCKLLDPEVPDQTPKKVDQSSESDPPTPKSQTKASRN